MKLKYLSKEYVLLRIVYYLGRELQTKWKSIRDNFLRELKRQKNIGPTSSQKKKYVFFDMLHFLIPIFEDRRTFLSASPHLKDDVHDQMCTDSDGLSLYDHDHQFNHMLDHQSSNSEPASLNVEVDPAMFTQCMAYAEAPGPMKRSRKAEMSALYDSYVEAQLQESDCEDRLGNRHFLLSLLPFLRKLPDEANLEVRLELMGVIQRSLQSLMSSYP